MQNTLPISISGVTPPVVEEDLNLGTLRFEFQTTFPISFGTNAKLYGSYLFVLSATVQLIAIDVSNPFGPFLAGSVAGVSSAFNLRQGGNIVVSFQASQLRIYDVSNPSTMVLLYGPTAAAGNVRCSSDGDLSAEYVYTYNPLTVSFHIIDISDPSIPRITGTAASGAFSNLANTHAYDNDVCYSSANGVLQAYDVSNPESIVLLSTLTLSGLSTSVDRIYSIKPLNSFLYCSVRLTGTTDCALLILNKNDPTVITEESITPTGGTLTLTPNIELFFPFVGINSSYDGSAMAVSFFDIRMFDAPEYKQDAITTPSGNMFQFSLIGNNYYEIGFSGVDSYIVFGANVSNVLAGTIQAGTVAVLGEVRAGSVNVTGAMTVRNNAWIQGKASANDLQAQTDVVTYKNTRILEFLYMMS